MHACILVCVCVVVGGGGYVRACLHTGLCDNIHVECCTKSNNLWEEVAADACTIVKHVEDMLHAGRLAAHISTKVDSW